MTKQAIWNGQIIAESSDLVNIEGNYYFPESDLKKDYFKNSSTETNCPWKGIANYYTLDVNGKENSDAAWYYAEPKDAAKVIKGRVAFWKGVEVIDV